MPAPRLAPLAALLLLVPGCIEDPAATPDLRAAPVTLAVPESAEYAGLAVQGSLSGGADGLRVDAVARNAGNRTYRVETGCGSPWTEELLRAADRSRVPLREPRASCGAFALADLPPGEERTFGASWDGRVWDEERGALVAAAPGDYLWAIRFVAYNPAAQDAQLKRFDLEFNVTVDAH